MNSESCLMKRPREQSAQCAAISLTSPTLPNLPMSPVLPSTPSPSSRPRSPSPSSPPPRLPSSPTPSRSPSPSISPSSPSSSSPRSVPSSPSPPGPPIPLIPLSPDPDMRRMPSSPHTPISEDIPRIPPCAPTPLSPPPLPPPLSPPIELSPPTSPSQLLMPTPLYMQSPPSDSTPSPSPPLNAMLRPTLPPPIPQEKALLSQAPLHSSLSPRSSSSSPSNSFSDSDSDSSATSGSSHSSASHALSQSATIDCTAPIQAESGEGEKSPFGRYKNYTYTNYLVEGENWRTEDFVALAEAVHTANDIHLSTSSSGNQELPVPPNLMSKPELEVKEVLGHLHDVLNGGHTPFAPKCTVSNLVAVIASEASFVHNYANDRFSDSLTEIESRKAMGIKQLTPAVLRDGQKLNAKGEKDRLDRTRALDEMEGIESVRDQALADLEDERSRTNALLQDLKEAKACDLESRRVLDQIRMQVAALQGKISIATVDKLVVADGSRQLSSDSEELSEDGPFNNNSPDSGSTIAEMDGLTSPSSSTSSAEYSSSSDDDSMDDDESESDSESLESGFLSARIEMIEAETNAWKEALRAEQMQYQMMDLSRRQTQHSLSILQAAAAKKGMASTEQSPVTPAHRNRKAVQLSIQPSPSMKSPNLSPRNPIRKGRKSKKPKKSCSPE